MPVIDIDFKNIGDYLRKIQSMYGEVRIMVAGDSIGVGTGYNQGLRAAICVGMILEGISPTFVGDNTGSTSQENLLYNSLGGARMLSHQCKGGLTVQNIVDGSSPLTALSVALKAYNPDIVILSAGTNGATASSCDILLKTVNDFKSGMPLVWIGALPSANNATYYYNRDSAREAYNDIIRAAIRRAVTTLNGPARRLFVDPAPAFGLWCRYPINTTGVIPASTDTTGDTVTFSYDPGFYSGQEVKVPSTVGGLTGDTTYYVNRNSATVYSFHTSRANGVAGTSKVDLTANITYPVIPNGMIANNNNANAPLSYDGTHPEPEGNLMLWAYAHAMVFGRPIQKVMDMFCKIEPYAPTDLSWGADIATTNVTIPGQSLNRKTVFESLTVYSNEASNTITVTITKQRISKDRESATSPTVTATIGQWAFEVAPGATRGKSFSAAELAAMTGGGVAWYNEVWNIAVANGTGNVEANFKQMVV